MSEQTTETAWVCETCGRGFAKAGSLHRHERTAHTVAERFAALERRTPPEGSAS